MKTPDEALCDFYAANGISGKKKRSYKGLKHIASKRIELESPGCSGFDANSMIFKT